MKPAALSLLLLIISALAHAAPRAPAKVTDRFENVTLVECHDGDTCTFDLAATDARPVFRRRKIRLRGIDAPELNGATRKEAVLARDALLALLRSAKKIDLAEFVRNGGQFGRDLATVVADGQDASTWLLNLKLVAVYR